ncbi:MAG: HAD family phosphatase [Ruminococcaceae bacterium]|nr:HAD family phosphatase [Oscillospiraceae bacterium]
MADKINNFKGIIALDLDGTLLDSTKGLSETNRETLAKAAEAGWVIVPTTGRFYGAIPQIVRELPFVRYAITINGAEVADLATEDIIYKAELPYQQVLQIMEFLDNYPLIYDIYQGGESFMTAAMKEQIDEMTDDVHYRRMLKELRQPVDDLKTFIAERKQDIQKTQFVTYDEEIHRQLMEILPQKFSDIVLTVTAKNNVEINNIKANKGLALWALADYLGVPRENTVSFGDALNDMAMIKAAGTGVAMANACEEIKAAADFITLSNDEDGVAYGINKFCLNNE